jgi:hypothetical protein
MQFSLLRLYIINPVNTTGDSPVVHPFFESSSQKMFRRFGISFSLLKTEKSGCFQELPFLTSLRVSKIFSRHPAEKNRIVSYPGNPCRPKNNAIIFWPAVPLRYKCQEKQKISQLYSAS